MNKRHYQGTQAILRAVSVLQAFRGASEPLTPQQIGLRAGINRSTAYRLLSALESEGFVVSDSHGRYQLGPELIVLGNLALRHLDLREIARPYLLDLAAQSGETVDLEILHGMEVLIIEEVASDHLLGTSGNIGRSYPAYRTSTGKVLLAALPEAQAMLAIEQLVADPAGREALAQELIGVRQQGYATSYEELEAHLHAVGAPIFGHQGSALAAVSVSGPAARLTRERESQIASLVCAACAAISYRLGYRKDG